MYTPTKNHIYASLIHLILLAAGALPKSPIPSLSPSRSWRRSMQSPYQLPHPLPPLPVRKGVRGRRPKSQTIAMLKAIQNGQTQTQSSVHKSVEPEHLEPRLHKKRGPKPGSKVGVTGGLTRFPPNDVDKRSSIRNEAHFYNMTLSGKKK